MDDILDQIKSGAATTSDLFDIRKYIFPLAAQTFMSSDILMSGLLGKYKNKNTAGQESSKAIGLTERAVVPNANNYRNLYLKENPGMPKEYQVHHTLPQTYEEILKAKGINIHEAKYLEGIDPNIHKSITRDWLRWDNSLGRTPTAKEIFDFAKQIELKYGEFWYNK